MKQLVNDLLFTYPWQAKLSKSTHPAHHMIKSLIKKKNAFKISTCPASFPCIGPMNDLISKIN